MESEIKKGRQKIVSFSQFTNWWTCPHKWYRDYILKEKEFEDNLHMTFGTAIHTTLQLYIKTLFNVNEESAEKINVNKYFVWLFKREIYRKKIPHTTEELNEFIDDGYNILKEFKDPVNRRLYFAKDKFDLIGIETDIREEIVNNVILNAKLDLILKEKQSDNIHIIDIKTCTDGWKTTDKENFSKTSQLILYKTLYSKKYKVPLEKIDVEFFILRRKIYDPKKVKYEQSRIQTFKPPSGNNSILEVIREFKKFVNTCFTLDGVHNTNQQYPKIPGKSKKNCKYCQYLKNKKCNAIPDTK